MKTIPAALIVAFSSTLLEALPPSVEQATYDAGGKLTSMVDRGDILPLRGHFEITFKEGPTWNLQFRLPKPNETSTRDHPDLFWHGKRDFPDGSSLVFETRWAEPASGMSLNASFEYQGDPRWIESLDYVIDCPREVFAGGQLLPAHSKLAHRRPENPAFFSEYVSAIQLQSPGGARRFSVSFAEPLDATVTDVWEKNGRFYRIRIKVKPDPDDASKWTFRPQLTYQGKTDRPIESIALGAPIPGYRFDGFGGNFCFGSTHPMADYMRENVRVAWSRHDLKLREWDEQRPEPGPELKGDFERIQKIENAGIPWILSNWRLPERLYTDPFAKNVRANQRVIAEDKWDELLDLIDEYLAYLKNNYGVEPDHLSFNEPNLGIGVFFTPESHRDAIKRIGRFLAERGYKTKMLLGDVTGPVDTYKFLLPTAADPEAMQYVSAMSFHSWDGASPEQYAAWGEFKEWMGIPLVVGEAGTDPFAWRNWNYDSHLYGLGEFRQMQELILYAHPESILYWQYTNGYRLLRENEEGEIEPTSRFWMTKQMNDLTPPQAQVHSVDFEDDELAVTAFTKGVDAVVHILNSGPTRTIEIAHMRPGSWKMVVSSATVSMEETGSIAASVDGTAKVEVPALSLTTLIRE